MAMTRRTLAKEITIEGTALHAGGTVRMVLSPAAPGDGIVFARSDMGGARVNARYDAVSETRLGTVIGGGDGPRIAVIEHLMAALAGAGLDDLLISVDGPEPPILDGDAHGYLVRLTEAGFHDAPGPRNAIKILKRVEVTNADASAVLEPADRYSFDFEIAFPTKAIGTQRMVWEFSGDAFARDIAPARTFGFMHELDALNKAGLGRGASLENTLAIDGDAVVNAGLMRFDDEFVRHKILDAIGDLALAGAPLIGRFVGRRSGHALNNALLRALFADPANTKFVAA